MAKYTVKRLLQSLVTILIVVTIVFLLLRMLPTDYYFTEDQLMKLTDQQKHDQYGQPQRLYPIGADAQAFILRHLFSLQQLRMSKSGSTI